MGETGNGQEIKNWLESYVTERSSERISEALGLVYQRTRTVELLAANQDELSGKNGLSFEDRTISLMNRENESRRRSVELFAIKPDADAMQSEWFVPFVADRATATGAVKWYLKLKDEVTNFAFVNYGLRQLNMQVFDGMRDAEWVRSVMAKFSIGKKLADVVADCIDDEPKFMGNFDTLEGDNRAMWDLFIQSQRELKKWVTKIGPDIDQLYSGTVSPGEKDN